MKCPSCGSAELEDAEVELEREVCGRRFKATGLALRCGRCGEEVVQFGVLGMFDLAIAADLAQRGPPSAEAFRFMRKAIALPAKELADLLAVTPETVSRWENDKLPVERRALALLSSIVLDKVEGRTATLERLRALAAPASPPPGEVRLRLRRA
ncbi:MAG TPA: hypothetical protein VN033_02860 [Vulgatibacter sp.]|nr:hypothetical protein [Vulgatibacter sp.]